MNGGIFLLAERCFYFNHILGGIRMVEYFKGVKKEISRIKWTNKKELIKYSVSTILFMLFFGVFFYAIDLLVALLRSSL